MKDYLIYIVFFYCKQEALGDLGGIRAIRLLNIYRLLVKSVGKQ